MKTGEKHYMGFYAHLTRNMVAGILFIAAGLYIGMLGYRHFEQMSWIDAFLNASMILSGMGPVTRLMTDNGKLFASFYALFSGLSFIMVVGLMLSPVLHKVFRKIHLDIS